MANTTAMCTSFKSELLLATHSFVATGTPAHTAGVADTFKIALYTSTSAMGAATTVYTTTNEITGTNYVAGGATLTSATNTVTGTTAFIDFADATWATATFTANGALIYNSTQANKAVCSLAFGGDKTATAGTFTVVFPANDATNAIIRLA